MHLNVTVAADKKRSLPESAPEFGVIDELESLEDNSSGVQPIAEAWEEGMRRAFANRDFERALDLGERLLVKDASSASTNLMIQEARIGLEQTLTKRLEPLDRVVVLRVSLDEMTTALLDHRAGFFLSRIDGHTTAEDLLDVAAMPRLDALRFICDWLELGFIALE